MNMMNKRLSDMTHWRRSLAPWEHKIAEPAAAFAHIRKGHRVFVASACAEPQFLMRALYDYAFNLSDVEIIHLLSTGNITFDNPRFVDHVRFNAFFIGADTRTMVAEGLADYTPIYLSEAPRIFRGGEVKIDIALLQISPPDKRGICSLGISVEAVMAAARQADYLIAQVNPYMPWVHGQSEIDIETIDALVPYAEELIQWHSPEPDETARQIAYHVSRLIEDGATLQIGIGKTPNAILPYLLDKRGLGIHTEMFSDNLIDLIESGAVTNENKGLHQDACIASFVMGTRRIYDYLHRNPQIQLYPADYVSDPAVVARNAKMTAINSALQVDLTGQVCADSIGTRFYSGFGSQVDLIRGAARSPGGKPIIAIPSTAKGGAVSRIVATLEPGSGVALTRGDVHFVVTEYGIAYLYGKTIRERAMALIEIASPQFRPALLQEAKRLKYVYPDQNLPSIEVIDPEQWKVDVRLGDEKITLRPIRPSDENRLQELFYSLSEEDQFSRFMGHNQRFPHRRVHRLTLVDYCNRLSLVATAGPEGRKIIIGIGTYERSPYDNYAEVAFTVREDYRSQGVARSLIFHLTEIARRNGIVGFRADVLKGNKAMLNLFHRGHQEYGHGDLQTRIESDGMLSLWYEFNLPVENDDCNVNAKT